MTLYTEIESPIGPLTIASNGRALTLVSMEPASEVVRGDWRRDDVALGDAAMQLREYFAGERREFTLPLEPAGTPFQQGVWRALREIPYGETRSYGQLAASLGAPGSARAVGAANGQNPLGIIVPCHRVIGADGSLTGYAGGMERKRWLLEHEAHTCGAPAQTALALG